MVEYKKQKLDLIFHAMANETRRQLLQRIIEQPSRVLALAEPFKVSLNAISKHLKVLEKAGLVKRVKKGQEHYFVFNSQSLKEANAVLFQLEEDWKERLERLDSFLTNKE